MTNSIVGVLSTHWHSHFCFAHQFYSFFNQPFYNKSLKTMFKWLLSDAIITTLGNFETTNFAWFEYVYCLSHVIHAFRSVVMVQKWHALLRCRCSVSSSDYEKKCYFRTKVVFALIVYLHYMAHKTRITCKLPEMWI